MKIVLAANISQEEKKKEYIVIYEKFIRTYIITIKLRT